MRLLRLMLFLVVAMLTCRNGFAQDDPRKYASLAEMQLLSDLVYDDGFGERRLPAGVSLEQGVDHWSGLRYAVYRRADGQLFLSFQGTRYALRDWTTNIVSSSSLSAVSWVPGMHVQYDAALQVARRLLRDNGRAGTGRPLIVVGDSKGGGQVQFVCGVLGCLGAAFDPAPLAAPLVMRMPREQRRLADQGQVLRVASIDDRVSKLDVLGSSIYVGRPIVVETSRVHRDAYYKAYGPLQAARILDVTYSVVVHTDRTLLQRALVDFEARSGPVRARSVPLTQSWWVERTLASETTGGMATANAIARAGVKPTSALVVADGEQFKHLANGLRAAFPGIRIERSDLREGAGIQAIARNLRTDLIVGVAEGGAPFPSANSRVILDRPAVQRALDRLDAAVQIGDRLDMLSGRFEASLPGVTKWARKLYKLDTELRQDLQRGGLSGPVELNSGTVRALTDIAVEEVVIRGLAGKNTPTFGLASLLATQVRKARDGFLDSEGLDKLADARAGLFAAIGGTLLCGLPCGAVTERVGVLTSQETRDFFHRLELYKGGHLASMVDQWSTLQASNVERDVRVQSFSEWLGPAQVASLRLPQRDIDFIDSLAPGWEALRALRHGQPVVEPATETRHYSIQAADRGATRAASQLAGVKGPVVVFGHGANAAQTSMQLRQERGANHVIHVQSIPTPAVRNQIARSYGATATVTIREDRYQEIVRQGVRQTIPLRPGTAVTAPASPVGVPAGRAAASRSNTTAGLGDRDRASRLPPVGIDRRYGPPPRRDDPLWIGGPPPGPPGGGGPPPPPGGGSTMSSLSPSLTRLTRGHRTPGVGGVMLTGAAQVTGSPSPAASNFSLIFEDRRGEVDVQKLRMFVTALWSVYVSNGGPGISIDPIAKGLDKHIVRYIGEVVNTDLGRVMREADYLMKRWAVGDGAPECVPEFRSPDKIAFDRGVVHVGAYSRFWFVPEGMTFRLAGNALLFEDGWMKLSTEYLGRTGDTGSSQENEEFARFFTNNYWRIAECYPIFEELFEYAKYVAFAKYLKEHDVPMFWFLLANRDLILTEDSPGVVDAFARQSQYIQTLSIEGGVDLGADPSANRYVVDQQTVAAINQALARLPSSSAAPPVDGTAIAMLPQSPELSFARPSDITVSGSTASGEVYFTDVALKIDGQPGLELTRHYNPELDAVSSLGGGWHAVVPYHIEPIGDGRTAFAGASLPSRVAVRNLLTGTREVLAFNTAAHGIGGYVPSDLAATTTIGLFVMTNGTFRLVDKLGNQFHFDREGDLVESSLVGGHRTQYAYRRDTVSRNDLRDLPGRLRPVGDDTRRVANAVLPARLELLWSTAVRPETFSLASNSGVVGYKSNAPSSRYRLLAVLSDGSFLLTASNGDEVRFDAAGRFLEAKGVVLGTMRREPLTVDFAYEFEGGRFRLRQARAVDGRLERTSARLDYAYGEHGELKSVLDSLGVRTSVLYSGSAVSHSR